MIPLQIIVLIVLTPTLFAGKTLLVTCGACSPQMSCKTPYCFTYTGSRNFMQKCTGIHGCTIEKPIEVNVFKCNLNILGNECNPKICFNLEYETIFMGINSQTSSNFQNSCEENWTEINYKCGGKCEKCNADKCLEKSYSFSSKNSDEKTMEKQCFKESCQNDQGYSLRERDPCPRGVDSFGIITAVVTFIAKLPPILVYASVNQSFKRQKVINGLRALAGSSRKEV